MKNKEQVEIIVNKRLGQHTFQRSFKYTKLVKGLKNNEGQE